jgi:hypothetical protein
MEKAAPRFGSRFSLPGNWILFLHFEVIVKDTQLSL